MALWTAKQLTINILEMDSTHWSRAFLYILLSMFWESIHVHNLIYMPHALLLMPRLSWKEVIGRVSLFSWTNTVYRSCIAWTIKERSREWHRVAPHKIVGAYVYIKIKNQRMSKVENERFERKSTNTNGSTWNFELFTCVLPIYHMTIVLSRNRKTLLSCSFDSGPSLFNSCQWIDTDSSISIYSKY